MTPMFPQKQEIS